MASLLNSECPSTNMLLWEWDPHGRAGLCKRCDGALQCTPKASVIQTKRHTLPMPLLRFPLTSCAVLCPELCFDSTAKQAGCLKVAQRKGCRLVSSAVVQARRGLLGGYTPLLKTDVAHGRGVSISKSATLVCMMAKHLTGAEPGRCTT